MNTLIAAKELIKHSESSGLCALCGLLWPILPSAPLIQFSQLAAPSAGSIENAALALAAIATLFLLGRKLLPHATSDSDFVAKPEFRALSEKVDTLRDKIDGRLVSLGDRIDRVGDSIHRRLNDLEAGLARVDERTRK